MQKPRRLLQAHVPRQAVMQLCRDIMSLNAFAREASDRKFCEKCHQKESVVTGAAIARSGSVPDSAQLGDMRSSAARTVQPSHRPVRHQSILPQLLNKPYPLRTRRRLPQFKSIAR